jgi:hypothetical protein
MRLRFFLALLPLMMHASAHAAWLHLCPQAGAPASAPSADTIGAGGERLRWLVDGQAERPGCRSIALPPGARVETLFPLAPGEEIERSILLHGRVREGRFAVSEHVLPSSRPAARPSPPAPMPLRANLLERMQARAFGVEERVKLRLDGGKLVVECGEGTRPAGVLLSAPSSGPWFLPRARLRLAASYAGDAGFSLQAADNAHAGRETALDLGELPARVSGADAEPARLVLPAALNHPGWRHFVLQCPAHMASIGFEALAIEPDVVPSARPAARSTWVWHAADWRDRGPALLDWAASHGVRALFVTVPFKDEKVREPAALARFIRAAGKRGIRVLSVDGDPHMVLPDHQAALARMARAYGAYNASVAPGARLAGLQFDVEPYLLPEYGAGKVDWDARYLAMARTLREAAGSLRLELVVPFWWDGKTALLDGLAPLVDALVVMDYRTDRAQVTEFALPFLDWGARHGKQVRIALEAGEIAAETQRRYVRAAAGEAADLLRLRVDGQQVLAVLKEAVETSGAGPAPADHFRLQSTREIDGSATTFHKNKDALLRLLPELEADFSAWDGAFGGIALHELR